MKNTKAVFIGRSAADMTNIADGSVGLVVTSPPYPMIEMWDNIFASQNENITGALNDCPLQAFELMHSELDKVWKEVNRVLIPGGIACINIGDATRTINGAFQLFDNHSRISNSFKILGLQNLPSILWRKQTNAPNKFMGSGMLPPGAYVTLEHEYILIFRKGNKRNFSSTEEKRNRQKSAFFWEERNLWFSDIWFDVKGVKQSTNVKSLRARTAAFPFELSYRLIQMFSVKFDLVLDPFVGTGTTLLAALASQRNSIGYEIDEKLNQLIYSNLKKSVETINSFIGKRIKNHDEFIAIREIEKGKMKYFNSYHQCSVMTRQEVDIEIVKMEKCIAVKDDMFVTTYKY